MKSAKAKSYRRQRQHERQRVQRQSQRTPAAQRGCAQELVYQIYQTIQHFFPALFDQMRQLEDCRKKADDHLGFVP